MERSRLEVIFKISSTDIGEYQNINFIFIKKRLSLDSIIEIKDSFDQVAKLLTDLYYRLSN